MNRICRLWHVHRHMVFIAVFTYEPEELLEVIYLRNPVYPKGFQGVVGGCSFTRIAFDFSFQFISGDTQEGKSAWLHSTGKGGADEILDLIIRR